MEKAEKVERGIITALAWADWIASCQFSLRKKCFGQEKTLDGNRERENNVVSRSLQFREVEKERECVCVCHKAAAFRRFRRNL